MSDDYDPPTCPVCGADQDRVTCWACGGAGGHHDCGEDTCYCLYPDDNVTCEECHGEGVYWECTALPHTAEQIEAHRASGNARRGA